MRVHTVGIYANPQKQDAVVSVARRMLHACGVAGLDFRAESWLLRLLDMPVPETDWPVGDEVEALIVLGGDGTLLRAMPYAVAHNIPLLGINLGRVGFLTEFEADLSDDSLQQTLHDSMERLALGAFDIERRMLLDVRTEGVSARLALNDAVISRGGVGGILSLDAYLGDALIDRYAADGLLVATPTGSTAYSLSTGGPVVPPDVSCLLLSPVCPHSLRARPMVFSPTGQVRLHVQSAPEGDVWLTTDGQHPVALAAHADVYISRATADAQFIRLQTRNFFDRLRTKLSEWSV